MTASEPHLHLPPEWRDALARAGGCRRVLVLGATDMGKTSFIRAFFDRAGGDARLIDLDPGQKMIGAPGTVTRGRPERVERLVFIGTTSASALSAIATGRGVPIIRLERSPLARPKSPAARAALRQAAFDQELDGAATLAIEAAAIEPGPLAPWASPARPVCSLADADGHDLAVGILQGAEGETLSVYTRGSTAEVRLVRLGKMWAEPKEGGWRLLERLSPSWGAG